MANSNSLYSEFHQGLKPGQGVCNVNHKTAGDKKPAIDAVVRFPFKIITDEGEVLEAGTLMKFSFWARESKNGKLWYSGGVSALGEKFYRGGSSTANGNTGVPTTSTPNSATATGVSGQRTDRRHCARRQGAGWLLARGHPQTAGCQPTWQPLGSGD
jgi:hypothetical protein